MKKVYLSMLSIGAICFLNSCYYDNFKELRPQGVIPKLCDTTGVISYALQIKPLLESSCTQSCHNPASPAGGDLTDPINVQGLAINGAVSTDGGTLYGALIWDGVYSTSQMPKNGSKLSECDLAKVKKWAAAGAPINN